MSLHSHFVDQHQNSFYGLAYQQCPTKQFGNAALKGSDCKQSFHAEYTASAQNKRQQAFISVIPTDSNLIYLYIYIFTLSPEKKGGKT